MLLLNCLASQFTAKGWIQTPRGLEVTLVASQDKEARGGVNVEGAGSSAEHGAVLLFGLWPLPAPAPRRRLPTCGRTLRSLSLLFTLTSLVIWFPSPQQIRSSKSEGGQRGCWKQAH